MGVASSQNSAVKMSFQFSLIVPTLGNKEDIEFLINSLHLQECKQPVQLLLCYTGDHLDQLKRELPPVQGHIQLDIILSPRPGIASARNHGLRHAKGEIILFMDDDCYLPHGHYLENATALFQKEKHLGFGGIYLSTKIQTHYVSSFYNYICNLWLLSFLHDGLLKITLGGCTMISKSAIEHSRADFFESDEKAAEEYSFNLRLQQKNIPVYLNDQVSVCHNARCSLWQLLRKAWNHGRALSTYSNAQQNRRSQTLRKALCNQPIETIKFFPLLAVFLLTGRIAFVLRHMEKHFVRFEKSYLKGS
jgi:glycosyltransferase involved in cell wall biosynthesis